VAQEWHGTSGSFTQGIDLFWNLGLFKQASIGAAPGCNIVAQREYRPVRRNHWIQIIGDIVAMTRPQVVFGTSHQSCADWIAVDVPMTS
jgi:hypothetical protein